MTNLEKAAHIKNKIIHAQEILIISSRPADPDCIGANLALRGWIQQEHVSSNCTSVIFGGITDRLHDFPGIENVSFEHVTDIDFDAYDVVIMLDGSHWHRIFTDNTVDAMLENIDMRVFVSIDHHTPGDILDDLGNQCLQEHTSSCTTLLYTYFFEQSPQLLTPEIATWLYYGLVDDTGRFTFEMQDNTFAVADALLQAGADHGRVVNEDNALEVVQFTGWAINHMEMYEHIHTILLCVYDHDYEELTELFGKHWERKILGQHFVETVFRKVIGYHYGVFFQPDKRQGGTRCGWRTRNYGNHIAIQEVLESIGFSAGGHFGAGGGYARELTVEQARASFIKKMEQELTSR